MIARRLALLAALTCASLLPSTPALAQPTGQEAVASVTVEAWLVKASRGEPMVDPSLRAIARDLTGLPYSRFEAVASGTWRTRPGGTVEGNLGGRRVVVQVGSVDERGATLVVEVLEGGRRISRTSVERPLGRAHVLSVGTDGGAALVLPVRVVR